MIGRDSGISILSICPGEVGLPYLNPRIALHCMACQMGQGLINVLEEILQVADDEVVLCKGALYSVTIC